MIGDALLLKKCVKYAESNDIKTCLSVLNELRRGFEM